MPYKWLRRNIFYYSLQFMTQMFYQRAFISHLNSTLQLSSRDLVYKEAFDNFDSRIAQFRFELPVTYKTNPDRWVMMSKKAIPASLFVERLTDHRCLIPALRPDLGAFKDLTKEQLFEKFNQCPERKAQVEKCTPSFTETFEFERSWDLVRMYKQILREARTSTPTFESRVTPTQRAVSGALCKQTADGVDPAAGFYALHPE